MSQGVEMLKQIREHGSREFVRAFIDVAQEPYRMARVTIKRKNWPPNVIGALWLALPIASYVQASEKGIIYGAASFALTYLAEGGVSYLRRQIFSARY